MNIKIYAPCNGEIKNVVDLNDGVFSNKLLGDGVVFTPSENDFYSISDKAVLAQIFETKHAYFFEIKGLANPILMHIGIDTVKLNGEPFEVFATEKQKLTLKDKIVTFNIDEIKKNNLKTETPIVFECNDQYEIKILKTGKVNRGEPIFEIIELNKNVAIEDDLKPVSFAGKYDEIAKEIYQLVGTNTNYRNYRNCMTRLRFVIKDKEKVNIEKIQKISIVKGINWSTDELQIIIGGEVYKVKEALDRYIEHKDEVFEIQNIRKSSKKDATLNFIKGVVLPMLPVMMSSSILQAVYTLLSDQVFGAFPTITNVGDIANYGWLNVMLYIIAYPGTNFIGIFFIYCTVKYLRGDTIIAVLIGITLISPYLFGGIQIEWFEIKFANVSTSFGIKAYPTSVIPMVFAGIIYVYTDKWIKTWMPTSVDIVFRHGLSILVTCAATFIVLGNVLGLLEVTIGYLVSLLNYIPFGLSAAIFAVFWQPLVLTGTHAAVWNALAIPAINDASVSIPMLFGPVYGVFGQYGAAIGIAIKTKNQNTRATALGAIPAATFGITEPLIFGSTLRNGLPFFLGCIGAGLGGIVYSGFFNGQWYMPNAQGIFSFLSVKGDAIDYLGWALGLLSIIGISIILVLLFYKERPNELKATQKQNKKVVKLVSELLNISEKEVLLKYSSKMNEINKIIKEELFLNIKDYEKDIIIGIRDAISLNNYNAKINTKKEKLAYLANKFYLENKIEKMKVINKKFNNAVNEEILHKLENKSYVSQIKSNVAVKELEFIQIKILKIVESMISEIYNETKIEEIKFLNNNYFNLIHSLDIAYEITQKETDLFKNSLLEKDEKQNEKTRISA